MVLTDALGNPIPDMYQEIRINMWNYSNDGNSTYKTLETNEIPLEQCNSESFGEFASMFTTYEYSKAKCIPYQKYNLTLFGTRGSVDPNSFINIVVNMCNNQTTNNTCPDKSVIAPVLRNVYLHFLYIDYSIDNYNFENPIQPYVRSESFPINWDLAARYFYQINSLSYITDVGSVFEDNKQISSHAYSNYVQYVQIKHGSTLYPGLTIGTLTIFTYTRGDKYSRSYPKLQTLLARIGGVIQGIMVISQGICYLITKNMFLVDMINSNFCCDVDEPESKKLTKLNKIEFSHSSNLHLSNVLEERRINASNIVKGVKEKKEKKEKKETMFKPGIFNYICPTYHSTKNRFAQMMSSAELILKKQMSYENLFRHLIHYERLKKILLSEEQSSIIGNLLRVNPEEVTEFNSNKKNESIHSIKVMTLKRNENTMVNLRRLYD